jgi:DNA-binding protein HU-beta
MNKTELIAVLATEADVTQKVAEHVLKAFTESVTVSLKKGEKVVITGFGTFE